MPTKYHVRPNSVDSHQADPHWMALVVRYEEVLSFDKKKLWESHPFDVAVDSDIPPMWERPALLLSNAITSWVINMSKDNHTSGASFELARSSIDYSKEIQPGDWLLFWVVDSEAEFLDLKNRLKKILNSPGAIDTKVNGFHDGLKFVGKANSPKQNIRITQNGTLEISYSLSAVQFSEFDCQVYVTPNQVALSNTALLGANDLARDIGLVSQVGLQFNPTDRIKSELRVWLGDGPPEIAKSIVGEGTAAARALSPNDQFLIPKTVSKIVLGNDGPGRYIDLLEGSFYGLQGVGQFDGEISKQADAPDRIAAAFKMTEAGPATGYYYGYAFTGQDTTIWSKIGFYANEPINEMYVTLRISPENRIKPFFVYRQSPFSSDAMSGYSANADGQVTSRSDGSAKVTAFKSLARWVIDTKMVVAALIGPSDSLKYNYIHFQGADVTSVDFVPANQASYVYTPPVKDSKGIQRDGLRTKIVSSYSASVNRAEPDKEIGRTYTQFLADLMMGAHLTWTGSFSCRGIVEPIPVGDNMEFNGIIYHIQSVSHHGSILSNGVKSFDTSITATHGMANEVLSQGRPDVYPFQVNWKDFPQYLQPRASTDIRSDINDATVDTNSSIGNASSTAFREV